jgi:hypothetical protein
MEAPALLLTFSPSEPLPVSLVSPPETVVIWWMLPLGP